MLSQKKSPVITQPYKKNVVPESQVYGFDVFFTAENNWGWSQDDPSCKNFELSSNYSIDFHFQSSDVEWLSKVSNMWIRRIFWYWEYMQHLWRLIKCQIASKTLFYVGNSAIIPRWFTGSVRKSCLFHIKIPWSNSTITKNWHNGYLVISASFSTSENTSTHIRTLGNLFTYS